MTDLSVDVAVVGGGLAGLAAARTAASHGARTALLEAGPALGGNASGAFVHTLCGLYHEAVQGSAATLAQTGFPARFAAALAERGAVAEPERAGRVWVRPLDPRAIEPLGAALCAEPPAVSLHLESRVVGARLAQRSAEKNGLTFESAGTQCQLEAAVVIDASGDGCLASLGGAAHTRADPAERQLPSYIVCLSGVPAQDREGFGRLRLTVSLADAVRRDALPAGCDAVLLRPAPGSDDAFLTLNLPRDVVMGGSPSGVVAEARRRIEAIVAHLRETREGYGDCRVRAWPRHLGVREGARLDGLATVEADALLAGTRSDEEVALSTWPVELWQDHRRPVLRHASGPFGIPRGALISRSHPRLGMAGRCLSADPEALGALRVLGTALATGEAIGIAAALAAQRGSGLADVPAAEIRQRIDPSTGDSATTSSRDR